MSKRYLVRLDDACPTMDAAKWQRMEDLLDAFRIRPMVGVIPDNHDPKQQIDSEDIDFWNKIKSREHKGWAIALHGYDHCYISDDVGINPLWNRSEFAGVPLEVQKQKILKGIKILAGHDIHPKYFFAPSHTFDENTLTALRECSDIRIISDTIATKPYRQKDFIFIPQLGGMMREMPLNGIWTFCLHPSAMSDADFDRCEAFLKAHSDMFISFSDIELNNISSKSILDKTLSAAYFLYRKIRGLK